MKKTSPANERKGYFHYLFFLIFFISLISVSSVNAVWSDYIVSCTNATRETNCGSNGDCSLLYDGSTAGLYSDSKESGDYDNHEVSFILNETIYLTVTGGRFNSLSPSTHDVIPLNIRVYSCLNDVCTEVLKYNNSDTYGSCTSTHAWYTFNTSDTSQLLTDEVKVIYNSTTFSNGNMCYSCSGTDFSSVYLYEIELTEVSTPLDNQLPTLKINNLDSVYCYNESDHIYEFYLNASDVEGDTIKYFTYWDYDFQEDIVVDDFSDIDYDMEANGWAFNGSGCNYTTETGDLTLYSGCDEIGMIKILYMGILNESLTVSFDAWVWHNTTNKYEIWNNVNEQVVGLQMERYYSTFYNQLYTNFSYFNGSEYIVFDTSYYTGVFGVEFRMDGTNVHYCISGIDEPSYTGCNYEIKTSEHGTTNNRPFKFFMKPTYDYAWEQYQASFVYLDNLIYTENNSIPFSTYSHPQEITHWIDEQRIHYLTVYITDHINEPLYRRYDYSIFVQGKCEHVTITDELDTSTEDITDGTREYIKAVPNGEELFNDGFWFILLILLFVLLLSFGSLPVSMIITGLVCFVGSFIISGDYVQMITSGTLIGLGVTIIVTKTF